MSEKIKKNPKKLNKIYNFFYNSFKLSKLF